MTPDRTFTNGNRRRRSPRKIMAAIVVPAALAAGGVVTHAASADLDADSLGTRTTRVCRHVAELAGDGDLLDTLHFEWFDRPEARATLAVLVKTCAVLKREVRLRKRGNGAIRDDALQRMLEWSADAVQRVEAAAVDPNFRPHRLRVVDASFSADSSLPPLFSLVDEASSTRNSTRFGDLDVLAALGMRVYVRSVFRSPSHESATVLARRIRSLGMTGSIRPALRSTAVDRLAGSALPVWEPPLTLHAWLTSSATGSSGDDYRGHSDPVAGEAWPSAMARRGVARGGNRSSRFVVDGLVPPSLARSATDGPSALRATMWANALDGMSLATIYGWRDLRDGTPSAHASLFTDPRRIETIAQTALELLRHGSIVTRFAVVPKLVIAVSVNAVDPTGDRWAPWVEPYWEALASRGIRFDVVPLVEANDALLRARYPLVVPLDAASDAPVRWTETVRAQLGAIGDKDATHPLTALFVRRCCGLDGNEYLGVVNLTPQRQRLPLRDHASDSAGRDWLTGATIPVEQTTLDIAPWQVRLIQWTK